MNNIQKFAHAVVAAFIVLADLWLVVFLGYMLPEGWQHRWYGLPMIFTLMFVAMVVASPAILLIDCLIKGKPIDTTRRERRER